VRIMKCYTIYLYSVFFVFFFSSRRRHTRSDRDWSSDVCSSDLKRRDRPPRAIRQKPPSPNCQIVVGWLVVQLIFNLVEDINRVRSEERRVGKECRTRWWLYQ